MIKKKLNILSLILLSVLFLSLFSTSYAMGTYEIEEMTNYLQTLQDKGVLNNTFMTNFKNTNFYTTEIKNDFYNSYIILMYENKLIIALLPNKTQIVNGTAVANSSWFTSKWAIYNSGNYTTLNWSYEFNKNGQLGTTGVIDFNSKNITYAYTQYNNINTTRLKLEAPGEFGGDYLIKPKLKFTAFSDIDNLKIMVGTNTYNNVNGLYYNSLKGAYWGEIENYNEIDTNLFDYNIYEINPDESFTLLPKDYILWNIQSLGDYILTSDPVYFKTNKLFKIEITYDEELTSYYYYLLPYGTNITAGTTINYIYSSGDSVYSVQDQAIQQQKNQDELMGFLTSSEVSSGEEPTLQDLSVPEVQDVTEDFFTWLMNSFLNILYNNNDSTLEIPLYNTTHYIRSDIYKLNIEPLKTFIQAGWWFIIGVPVLKYIRRSIERLKGGELPATDDKSDLLGNIL